MRKVLYEPCLPLLIQRHFALTQAIRAGYTACTESADREEYAGQTSHSEPEGCKPAPPPCRNRPVSRDRSPDKPTWSSAQSKKVKGRRLSPVTMRRHITRLADSQQIASR